MLRGGETEKDGVGHIINSSHPHLPPPYDRPNVQLHQEAVDGHFDPDSRPPLVIAQTLIDIPVWCELLVDYHWLLIGIYTPLFEEGTKPLTSCGCENCEFVVHHLMCMYC